MLGEWYGNSAGGVVWEQCWGSGMGTGPGEWYENSAGSGMGTVLGEWYGNDPVGVMLVEC